MMMKTRILGVLCGAFLFTACGPSPTDVCDHMIELAKKEEGSEALVKKAEEGRSECVSSMESAKEMQGAMKYNETANCIVDATSMKDAMACQK